MTYRECYGYGIEALTAADIADAMIDARLLLEFVCHTTRHDLLLHGDRQVDHEKEIAYKACIARRSERIPLQHITDSFSAHFCVSYFLLVSSGSAPC